MALPTRPSGDQSRPKSESAAQKIVRPVQTEPAPVALPPTRDEAPPATRSRPAPDSQRRPADKPAPRVAPAAEVRSEEEPLPEDWAIDPKTGKKYRKLPKTKMGDDNRPLLQIPDFNLDDLTGEANTFLAHLRVPPDKEEQKRLRELKAQMTRDANAKYAKAHKDADEDESFN